MSGLILSIIGSAIVMVAGWLLIWIRGRFSLYMAKADPRRPSYIFNTVLILGWILNIASIFIVFLINQEYWWLIPIFSVWCLMATIYIWIQRINLRKVGIVGMDLKITKGIDYTKALKLCRNTLSFLGIGARKLTRENEFEQAIRRCNSTEPIKFLLCKPEHKQLEDAALRYGVDREEYKKRVTDSLRVLARYKEKYSNIQVRFYPEFQWFRLMFIDDSLCLVSYNIMGEGDGSQLPQLHLATKQGERESDSYYHVFARYFNDLWGKSEDWDFQQFI